MVRDHAVVRAVGLTMCLVGLIACREEVDHGPVPVPDPAPTVKPSATSTTDDPGGATLAMPDAPLDFVGRFVGRLEHIEFKPCDGDRGWVAGPHQEKLVRAHQKFELGKYEPAFARLRGTKKGPGSFGHFGGWTYEYTVTEVLELRKLKPGDCPP